MQKNAPVGPYDVPLNSAYSQYNPQSTEFVPQQSLQFNPTRQHYQPKPTPLQQNYHLPRFDNTQLYGNVPQVYQQNLSALNVKSNFGNLGHSLNPSQYSSIGVGNLGQNSFGNHSLVGLNAQNDMINNGYSMNQILANSQRAQQNLAYIPQSENRYQNYNRFDHRDMPYRNSYGRGDSGGYKDREYNSGGYREQQSGMYKDRGLRYPRPDLEWEPDPNPTGFEEYRMRWSDGAVPMSKLQGWGPTPNIKYDPLLMWEQPKKESSSGAGVQGWDLPKANAKVGDNGLQINTTIMRPPPTPYSEEGVSQWPEHFLSQSAHTANNFNDFGLASVRPDMAKQTAWTSDPSISVVKRDSGVATTPVINSANAHLGDLWAPPETAFHDNKNIFTNKVADTHWNNTLPMNIPNANANFNQKFWSNSVMNTQPLPSATGSNRISEENAAWYLKKMNNPKSFAYSGYQQTDFDNSRMHYVQPHYSHYSSGLNGDMQPKARGMSWLEDPKSKNAIRQQTNFWNERSMGSFPDYVHPDQSAGHP